MHTGEKLKGGELQDKESCLKDSKYRNGFPHKLMYGV
jgi:hypothetical protein